MSEVSIITNKILAEAEAFAKDTINDANAEAQKTTADFAAKAKAHTDEVIAQTKEKVLAIEDRAISQSEMDRRKMILSSKQEVIGDSFKASLAKLCSLDKEIKILLMVELAIKYQTSDAELIFNKQDKETIADKVVDTVNSIYSTQQIKNTFSGSIMEKIIKLVFEHPVKHKAVVSDQEGEFAGGFILKEGNIEKNCTFEVLVNSMREELEGEVSSILFG